MASLQETCSLRCLTTHELRLLRSVRHKVLLEVDRHRLIRPFVDGSDQAQGQRFHPRQAHPKFCTTKVAHRSPYQFPRIDSTDAISPRFSLFRLLSTSKRGVCCLLDNETYPCDVVAPRRSLKHSNYHHQHQRHIIYCTLVMEF